MEGRDQILNWKLLHGSHGFPGPDGGTCINEAAIVAAGFAYRPVRQVGDLPPCFCPVIGQFSVWMNDSIFDPELRMRLLLPFVTRLAGTRGSSADQKARIEVLRRHLAAQLPAKYQRRRFSPSHLGHLILGPVWGSWFTRRFTIATAANLRELLCIARFMLAETEVAGLERFWAAMADALGAMLEVGPRPDPLETGLVAERFQEARLAVSA